jgi:mono/diheme cytochrome c family protein
MIKKHSIFGQVFPLILSISLIILTACGADTSSTNLASMQGSLPASDEKPQSRAAEIYAASCASCHGPEMQGGNAQSLIDGVWQFGDGKGYVSRNIKFGIPHLGMPSYENTLTNKEIDLLVEFLYEAEARAGVVKPDPPDQLESLEYTIKSEVWIDKLDIPWAIVFLNRDTALVTEKPGALRVIVKGELLDKPVAGIPKVVDEGRAD